MTTIGANASAPDPADTLSHTKRTRRVTTDQQRTVLFVTGLVVLAFILSPAFPIERDPWPFIILIGGMIGVPVFVHRDRNSDNDLDS